MSQLTSSALSDEKESEKSVRIICFLLRENRISLKNYPNHMISIASKKNYNMS